MSNSFTPTADVSDDFLNASPALVTPEKKKKVVTSVYKLGPLKITRKKEVRTDKKPSVPAKLMQKLFTCGTDCTTAACAD